jgi:predicted nucleic acid-binding protein
LKGVVVDASVALAWCFPDEESDYAESVLFELEIQAVVVPPIWAVEIANVLLAGERRKRIRQPEIRRFVDLLEALSVVEDRPPFTHTFINVVPLARKCNLSTYDAAYLDVALRHRIPLATLDGALQRACKMGGVDVFMP